MGIKKQTKSILAEIFESKPEKTNIKVLESRAEHVFTSMFNLIESIDNAEWDQEDKDDLIKRILLSVKNKDTSRFKKAVDRMDKKYDGKS